MNKTRRKLALATWTTPTEGNIFAKLTVDIEKALAWIEEKREESGTKVTVTSLVGSVISRALASAPGFNGYIRMGSYVPHDQVALSFLVVTDDGKDLAKVKISEADTKSVVDIATELKSRANRVREGKDEEFESSKNLLRIMPAFLIRPILWLTGWLTSSLGISLKSAGLSAFPFGAAVITSVGMFGVDEAFVPQTPFARVPLWVLIGSIKEVPAVVDGEIAIRRQLTITTTVDHRFVDGFEGARMMRLVRELLEDPSKLES